MYFRCHFARSCWLASGLGHVSTNGGLFVDWFDQILTSHCKEQSENATVLMWEIWKSTNYKVRNRKAGCVLDVSHHVQAFLSQ